MKRRRSGRTQQLIRTWRRGRGKITNRHRFNLMLHWAMQKPPKGGQNVGRPIHILTITERGVLPGTLQGNTLRLPPPRRPRPGITKWQIRQFRRRR